MAFPCASLAPAPPESHPRGHLKRSSLDCKGAGRRSSQLPDRPVVLFLAGTHTREDIPRACRNKDNLPPPEPPVDDKLRAQIPEKGPGLLQSPSAKIHQRHIGLLLLLLLTTRAERAAAVITVSVPCSPHLTLLPSRMSKAHATPRHGAIAQVHTTSDLSAPFACLSIFHWRRT